MTEKQDEGTRAYQETCENCGKTKRQHTTVVIGRSDYPEGITVETADWEFRCSPHDSKKFTPKKGLDKTSKGEICECGFSPCDKDIHKDLGLRNQEKGCGKRYGRLRCGKMTDENYGWLCPTCQEKEK